MWMSNNAINLLSKQIEEIEVKNMKAKDRHMDSDKFVPNILVKEMIKDAENKTGNYYAVFSKVTLINALKELINFRKYIGIGELAKRMEKNSWQPKK